MKNAFLRCLSGRKCSDYLLIALFLLPGMGCSSLTSHYSMEPQEESGWTVRSEYSGRVASFREPGLELDIVTPFFGGSKQHSLGPCLFPVIPLGKVMSGPGLQLRISVRPDEASRIEIKPEDWTIRLRTRNMEGMFGEVVVEEAAPTAFYDLEGQGQLPEASLHYGIYGPSVESFSVQGAVWLDGRRIELPLPEFETVGTLQYIPYTTQILNLL